MRLTSTVRTYEYDLLGRFICTSAATHRMSWVPPSALPALPLLAFLLDYASAAFSLVVVFVFHVVFHCPSVRQSERKIVYEAIK